MQQTLRTAGVVSKYQEGLALKTQEGKVLHIHSIDNKKIEVGSWGSGIAFWYRTPFNSRDGYIHPGTLRPYDPDQSRAPKLKTLLNKVPDAKVN